MADVSKNAKKAVDKAASAARNATDKTAVGGKDSEHAFCNLHGKIAE